MRALLAVGGVDVNEASGSGFTPLIHASMAGHGEMVRELLAVEGVAVNLAEGTGCTPLYIAAQQGHGEVVRALLAAEGVEVNRARGDGGTSLLIAAMTGQMEVVDVLLQHGAVPDQSMVRVNHLLHDSRHTLSNYSLPPILFRPTDMYMNFYPLPSFRPTPLFFHRTGM